VFYFKVSVRFIVLIPEIYCILVSDSYGLLDSLPNLRVRSTPCVPLALIVLGSLTSIGYNYRDLILLAKSLELELRDMDPQGFSSATVLEELSTARILSLFYNVANISELLIVFRVGHECPLFIVFSGKL